jgi:squalene-associated FAD-dependent desaturase
MSGDRAAMPDETARGSARSVARPHPPRVAIVGGGLAGLACASGLVDRDLAITLYESRTRLGGRASSFTDPVTGTLVDNCQHVSMSCCTNLDDFSRRVGISELFKTVERIEFIGLDGKVTDWKAGPLPAPFHLAGSFLRTKFLTLGDKLRIAYALACLRFAVKLEARSFEGWLRAHGQNERTIRRFWATVLVSALNERLDQMDVGHARKVFLDGMMRTREGYRLEIPRVPLGELYGTRLEAWLRNKRVALRLGTGVRQVVLSEEGVAGLQLRNGEFEPADLVVIAVPFDRASDLLPSAAGEKMPDISRWSQIHASPITGIHVWFDRTVCPVEHAVVIDRTIQWVFNHTRIQGNADAADSGQYLQLVVSASHELLNRDKAAILEIALRDLSELWPAAKEARVLRSWVVTEHGATFSVRPGVDRLRPLNRTAIDGLYLAGDWTQTGWPATMEGAVRSGYRAAEEICAQLGLPVRIIRPDLPAGWLANLLLGRPTTTGSGPRAVSPMRVAALR